MKIADCKEDEGDEPNGRNNKRETERQKQQTERGEGVIIEIEKGRKKKEIER